MRRTSILVVTLVALGLTATVALAASVHFKKGSPQFADQGLVLNASGSLTATTTSALPSAALPPRERARLNAAVHRGFGEAAAPGVIVGVQTPKGRWVKAIGIANERSKAPMRASMHQRIGSVTKTFMGALLMQLAGEHKLSLGDKVSQYIEGAQEPPSNTPTATTCCSGW